jgi:tryptophan synthase beta chain
MCPERPDAKESPVSTVKRHKVILDEREMPTRWYNILHDLPTPPPPYLHPGTGQPVGPEDLLALFPMDLIQQEMTTAQYVDIPPEVLDVYRLWRPSPLYRAHRLEAALGTPARIYYKYEGVSPAGSHKPNTSVPQAYYNAKAGIKKLTTETGAGQWGTSLAFACAQFGLECEVWQVRASLRLQALSPPHDGDPRRHGPPVTVGVDRGRAGHPRRAPGLAGLAGHRDLGGRRDRCPVRVDQLRARIGAQPRPVAPDDHRRGGPAQLAKIEETPDLIVGCTGGGSNFAGLSFPFLREKLAGKMSPVIRGVEPASCPSLTQGTYAYDFGDTAGMTPLMKMHTLGHDFIPDPIHAGGLRYHGMSPLISHIYESGLIEAVAKKQLECFARVCSSLAPRASSRHLSPPTRWPRRRRGVARARRPARRRSSSRRSAGTVTSTCRPTAPTSRAR